MKRSSNLNVLYNKSSLLDPKLFMHHYNDLEISDARFFLVKPEMFNSKFVMSQVRNASGIKKCTTHYSFHICQENFLTYRHNKKQVRVNKGQYLFVSPNQSLEFDIQTNFYSKDLCIHICKDFLNKAISALTDAGGSLENPSLRNIDFIESLQGVFSLEFDMLGTILSNFVNKINSEALNGFPKNTEEIYYDFTYHLANYIILTQKQFARIKAKKTTTKTELLRRLYKAECIINENLQNDLSMKELSKEASLSEFHFYRAFKDLYGKAPYQYLLEKRLNKAKELISKGKLSIKDIAFCCGFSDLSTFSRSFKNYYGFAPTLLSGKPQIE